MNSDNARTRILARVNELLSLSEPVIEESGKTIVQNDEEDDIPFYCPPLESVMCVPATARRNHFFESVSIGDVFMAKVISSNDQGHVLTAICFFHRRRFIDDLGIRLLCPRSSSSLGDILKVNINLLLIEQNYSFMSIH